VYPVAIAIPNPYFVASLFFPPPANPYKKVDEVRARQVWDAIARRKSVSFTLRAEDLYQGSVGAAQLACTKSVPIIQSMALFVARSGPENDALNGYAWSVPLVTSPELAFAGVPGPLDMQFTNLSWLTGQSRMLFGEPAQAVDKFHQLAAATPVLAGLSPLSSFEIDVSSFGVLPFDPFTNDSAQALIVVMDVDPRDVAAPGLVWPATCK
jgi:hypothetical protein